MPDKMSLAMVLLEIEAFDEFKKERRQKGGAESVRGGGEYYLVGVVGAFGLLLLLVGLVGKGRVGYGNCKRSVWVGA